MQYIRLVGILVFGVVIGVLSQQTVRGQAQSYQLDSPDGNIRVQLHVGDRITYSVYHGENELLDQSSLSLKLAGQKRYGEHPSVKDVKKSSADRGIQPVVPLKDQKLQNRYRELKLRFESPYSLVFRVYNEGVAYRFELSHSDSVEVEEEEVSFRFAGNFRILYPREQSLMSHYERIYIDTTLSGLEIGSFCSLPTTVQTPEGITMAISDADLFDYPNLFLTAAGNKSLKSKFPRKVLETKQVSDRNQQLTHKADHIASVRGSRALPWRAVKINEDAAGLLDNSLFYMLARDTQIANTNWIKPGKVSWDWWNALNIYNVPFEAGINTKTYKYYIDFAAKYDLEYVILDEGWSNTTDLLDVKPEIDIPELVRYADDKDVGLILWMLWKPLQEDMERYMAQFEEWGIRGLKVDFMQRGDQDMVQYYERVARKAAEYQLLVNFHGAFKPAGLRRAYPNVMTYEGVKGLENSKWNDLITPKHDVTLPFTRMTAGPMDYTPGAMINADTSNFRAIYTRPMSQGTRAHQVAMYTIYESGQQMFADSPTHYKEESETTAFMSRFPVTWHETRVLDAKLAEFVVIARRHDRTWYIGAMTDSKSRQMEIDLSFLESGVTYQATLFKDGINADRYAEDYRISREKVNNNSTLQIKMAEGGGWSAILKPVQSD